MKRTDPSSEIRIKCESKKAHQQEEDKKSKMTKQDEKDSLLKNGIPGSMIHQMTSNIEGQCTIEKVSPLQLCKKMIVLSILFSIASAGIYLLLLRWSFRFRRSLLYVKVSSLREATHVQITNSDGIKTIQKMYQLSIDGSYGQNRTKVNQIKDIHDNYQCQWIFENRKMFYIIEKDECTLQYKFQAIEYTVCGVRYSDLIKADQLTPTEVRRNQMKYGRCEKRIEIPSLCEYLSKELSSPFQVLQYCSVVLWIEENYIQFAILVVSLSFVILMVNYALLTITFRKLQQMSITQSQVMILRTDRDNGHAYPSNQIVVGDIICIQEKTIMPCDAILISGNTLMNEVTLTGESLPIPKIALLNSHQTFDYSQSNQAHILFEGTEVVSSRNESNKHVLAKVIRVGFSSLKGQIIRSVLYPRPAKFNYNSNAIKFLLGLLGVVLIIYASRVRVMYHLNFPGILYFYRFFDTISWIIPPFLPIFQSLSITLALLKLRAKSIYGIDPSKTFLAGKVTHMCFDKTGTLTESGMKVRGYLDEGLGKMRSREDVETEKLWCSLQHKLFATCHGVHLVDGQLYGDVLDLEMLKFSGYSLQSGQNNDMNIQFQVLNSYNLQKLQVLRVFEFSSDVQRMSCVVRILDASVDSSPDHYLFVKGACEKIIELSQPASLPTNLKKMYDKLSLSGYKVIALAYRRLNGGSDEMKNLMKKTGGMQNMEEQESLQGTENMSVSEFSTLSREQMEQNLIFLGLLVLENPLKQDTPEAIRKLQQAHIDCRIISGDHPLTSIQTAINSYFLDKNVPVHIIDANVKESFLTRTYIEFGEICEIRMDDNHRQLANLIQQSDQIVITGKVLDLFESLPNYFIQSSSSSSSEKIQICNQDNSLMRDLIRRTAVFARMRPNQKRIIVEQLQSSGLVVGMIGDGANDCPAIKQGDIGISFATADASLSAPFSAHTDSIQCVQHILLQGRATLSINMEIFRTIVTQNALKYLGVMVLLEEASNFAGFQYTYLSFMIGMPFLLSLMLSIPADNLHPFVPDHRLQGLHNQCSMYNQILVFGFAFVCGYYSLINQDWHIPLKEMDTVNGVMFYNQEGELNSVIFLMLNAFYSTSCLTYFTSYPFKKAIYNNIILSCLVMFFLMYNFTIIIRPEFALNLFNISPSLQEHPLFMLTIFGITFLASFLVFTVEKIILPCLIPMKKIQFQQSLESYQSRSECIYPE